MSTQVTDNSTTQEALLALFNQSKEGVKPVISDVSAEEYNAMENSVPISLFQVPYKDGKNVWRQDRGNTKVPCQVTSLVYRRSLIKSTAKDSFGDLIKATSIDIMGYDVVRDVDNNPLFTEVPNPLAGQAGQPETIKQYELITMAEDGVTPLEPKKLMEFRPAFGLDTNKSVYNRPRDADMLVMVPNMGVPRKKRDTKKADDTEEEATLQPAEGVTTEQAKRSSTTIAWELIPGLEEAMKKPLRNAKLMQNTILLDYIADIPTASNAPSRKAEGGGKRMPTSGTTTKQAAANIPDNAFAGAPEES